MRVTKTGLPGGRVARPVSAALAAAAVFVAAGCGGDAVEVTDASGGRPFAVAARASFATTQRLSRTKTFDVVVTNRDSRSYPNVTVELGGLQTRDADLDNGAGPISDARRPVWIVDATPSGASDTYERVWSLGRLAPGARKVFRWKLTPALEGRHALTWTVTAAVDERAPMRGVDGSRSKGRFDVRIGKATEASR